ncbi:MAG TPA: ATP-dependent DNA helicase [Flavipsychrobacter sp.]|nr:ATP-dependent DNA helicase [Flavipsychrobacter sp.]
MKINEVAFLERYKKLNEEQKAAVDTVYGPVMVIAGPGTGKTEVLSMRIANLLRSDTQVQPQEILCLTFTDEGTVAMRRRLQQIIGEAAHKVHIFTFHAFCNSIIQSNPDYFGFRELTPISDLEKIDIIYDIIKTLPEGHGLRRLKGDIFYDAKNLLALFDLMKSEGWSSEKICEEIDWCINDFPNQDRYQYKKANSKKEIKVGDPKVGDIKKEAEKLERTRLACMLYSEYEARMRQGGRYDFGDMILWVLRAFKEHPEFLQRQQERFQFILADEFQDTSGAQYELLTSLSDYWEDPNLFIVGDDDQSIFEFQGARLHNIIDFHNRYNKSIRVIVLKQNYRSSQFVLDTSAATIRHNEQRLITQLKELKLDKNIIAANERFTNESFTPPVIYACCNQTHEEAYVVEKITALHESGVPLNNVAVLYAQHKQATNIITLLEKKSIPYWVKRPVNILELPLITQLLDILRYIESEKRTSFSGEEKLFRLMHAPFFGIKPLDVAALSIYLQSKEKRYKYWRQLLQDSLLLETMDLLQASALYKFGQNLEQWISRAGTLTLPMLLEEIIHKGGVTAHLLRSDNHVWNMQVLHTFFSFVQEECAKNPRLKIVELLQMVEQMMQEAIPIAVQKVVKQENGVRFYTAFSSKGHEFEHVFVIGANKKYWEGKTGNNRGFTLPDTLINLTISEGEDKNKIEVARRVFYVAMTRAKKHLYVSFSKADNKGKDLESSCFVDEIKGLATMEDLSLEDAQIIQHIGTSFLPTPEPTIELARKELIEKRLEQFVLSVSAMNRYLNCPVSFYYEYILRVPEAKSDALSFGIAIHYALEQLFKKMLGDSDKQFPSLETVRSSFKYMMRREESSFTELQFQRRLELGDKILTEYYNHYLPSFNKVVVSEFNISQVVVNGVPIKGKLDKIEFEGKDCVVVDYKTGNPEYASRKELMGPSEENPNGGDYWRQMVFYRLLLDGFPAASTWRMTAGLFDFIEKNSDDKFVRYTVPIGDNDLTIVRQQIADVYTRINNHEFGKGCNKETCRWCNFAKSYELVKPQGEVVSVEIDP